MRLRSSFLPVPDFAEQQMISFDCNCRDNFRIIAIEAPRLILSDLVATTANLLPTEINQSRI